MTRHTTTERTLISADAVVPMQGEILLHDAGVVMEGGRIAGVGMVADLRKQFGEMPREHVAGLMLPGFVNAHVHLELGYQRRASEGPAEFTEWVAALLKKYPAAEHREAVITEALRAGVAESLAAGITCVGDISRQVGLSRPVLARGPLRAVSFGEVVGLGKMRANLYPMLDAAGDRRYASQRLTVGVSPHAPYTVEGPSLQAIVRQAVTDHFPLAMHLAELPGEADFLRDLSGPLGREWDMMLKMDILDAAIPLFPHGPLRWAEAWGLLGEDGAARRVPVVLAHVNDVDDAGISLLQRSGASVVYCPRTREFFGHEKRSAHPYRALLAADINVCLGTDSLASNPDLSVLKEAELLHRRDGLAARAAVEMITWRGAKALGVEAGRLVAGAYADVIVLPVAARETLEITLSEVLSRHPTPTAVWVGGERAVSRR